MRQFTRKIDISARDSGGSAPRIPILFTILSLVFVIPAEATTYYLSQLGSDENSCATATSDTATDAKATMGSGIACMTAVGDILKIHAGTYDDYIHDNMFVIGGVSWEAGQFQTIQDAGDGQVTIQPTFTIGQALHMGPGIAYVLFKNLTLDALYQSTTDFGSGALYSLGNYLKYDTIEVMNGTFAGIYAFGDHTDYTNMHVHRNGNDPPANGLAAEGVYMTGSYNTIIGGEYDNNECNAIRISDSNHGGAFSLPPTKSHDNLVSGVTIHDNGLGHAQLTNGLSQCRTGGGALTVGDYDNTVVNNLIYNGYWGYDDTWAQDEAETGGNIIANNTIYNVDFCCLLNSRNTLFANNICFQMTVLPPCAIWSDEGGTAGTNDTITNNLLNTDPNFVDGATDDLRLQQGSAAIDAGITVDSVPTDFSGVPRPQGIAYAVGAYEYHGTQ